jgi:hypothetical protein
MTKIAVALAACAALACAGSSAQKKPVTVSDSDYGRLQPGQTQLVDQARADLGNARDALARAKLRQSDAKNEAGVAEADLQAAASEKTLAVALAKQAKASADPAEMERARGAAERAELRRRTAESHRDYVRMLEQARAAEVVAAERRVLLEEARVEQAKLKALQAANVPAATKYPGAELDARVANARKDLEQAENEARKRQSELWAAEQKWQELNRQMQASGGAAPRG